MIPTLLLALTLPAFSQPQTLDDAQAKARVQVELETMRRSLDRLATELESSAPAALDDSEAHALRARLDAARRAGGLPPELSPALDRLDAFYAEIPRRSWASEFAGPLADAGALALREAAEQSSTKEELFARLDSDLRLPADLEAGMTEGIPLSKWMTFGVVKRFLYRYRLRRPKHYRAVTAEDLVADRVNVEVGVELTGVAQGGHRAKEDKDWCFFLNGVEVEITPNWYLTHPKLYLPKTGETVRVRGWTYYDNFHPDEVPRERPTLFEIHPAYEVEVLAPAPAPAPIAGTSR